MKKITSVRAFTLIELLIVIAIIAILTGVILASLQNSRSKARDGKRISDIGQIQLALEQFFDHCGQYPTSIGTAGSAPSGVYCQTDNSINLSQFISQIPNPPSANTYDYAYHTTSGGVTDDYVLHTQLENANDGIIKDSLAKSLTGYSFAGNSFTCPSFVSGALDYCVGPK